MITDIQWMAYVAVGSGGGEHLVLFYMARGPQAHQNAEYHECRTEQEHRASRVANPRPAEDGEHKQEPNANKLTKTIAPVFEIVRQLL